MNHASAVRLGMTPEDENSTIEITIEDPYTAREMGYQTLQLETGLKQPGAIRLYERAGYTRIPCYGLYADDPLSVCFLKPLP